MKNILFVLLFLPLAANALWGIGGNRSKEEGQFLFRVGDSLATAKTSDAFQTCKKSERGSNTELAIELYECADVKPYISLMKIHVFDGVLFCIEVYFKKTKESDEVFDGLKAKYGEPTSSQPYKPNTYDDYVALGDSAAYGQLIQWSKIETSTEFLATGLICINASRQPVACGWAAKKLAIYDLLITKKWNERKAAAENVDGNAAKNKLGF